MADSSPILPRILAMQTPTTTPPKVSFSPALIRTSGDEYAKIIASILHDAVNQIAEEHLVRDLKKLFMENAVSDDQSFGCMDEDDLPAKASLSPNPDYDKINVLSVPPVRKALCKIRATVEILAGKHYLQAGVRYSDIQMAHNEESNAAQIGRGSSASTSSLQTKEIRPLTVDKFSGKLEDFTKWQKSVEIVFRKHGMERYLTSSIHCSSHPTNSSALVGSLQLALQDSTISAKAEKHKDKSCADFYTEICGLYDSQVIAGVNQFTYWLELFQLSLDSIDDFESYRNQVETIVQKLKGHKSKALDDLPLMRALISRSITVPLLDDVMTGIQTDTNLDVDDIMKKVSAKCTAIKSRETLTESSSGQVSVRRGEARKSDSSKTNQQKKKGPWSIPRFPSNMGDYMQFETQKALDVWRKKMNGLTWSQGDREVAANFQLRLNPKHKLNDRSSSRSDKRGDDRTSRYNDRNDHRNSHRDRDPGRGGSRNNRRYNDQFGKYGRRGEKRSYSRSRSRSRSHDRERSIQRSRSRSRSPRRSSSRTRTPSPDSRKLRKTKSTQFRSPDNDRNKASSGKGNRY